MTSKSSGFTLIELLVVVAILGIIAAVGIVSYNGYVNLHDTSTTSIDVKTCFTVDSECSTSGNVLEKTITVE